jgi:glucoamylase
MNLKTYIDSFRSIYAINGNMTSTSAAAVGRYAEDVYFGGNPWYLTTLAVAEQLYDAKAQWSRNGIVICNRDLPFWQSIYPSARTGTYQNGQNETSSLISAVLNAADSYLNKTLEYVPEKGALAEQYSRENGTAISARDLTWSYASFITMRNARAAAFGGPSVPSWGASNHTAVSGSCQSGSVIGTYTPAVHAGAPDNATSCTVLVTFNLNATTFFGENMYMIGNTSELGNFNSNDALAGSATNYTAERPLWNFVVELPAGVGIGYRYLRLEPNGTYIAENRTQYLAVQACKGGAGVVEQTVEDAWNGLA